MQVCSDRDSGSFHLLALPRVASILQVTSWSKTVVLAPASFALSALGSRKGKPYEDSFQKLHKAFQIKSHWPRLSHMATYNSNRVWKMQFMFQAITCRLKMGEGSITIEDERDVYWEARSSLCHLYFCC